MFDYNKKHLLKENHHHSSHTAFSIKNTFLLAMTIIALVFISSNTWTLYSFKSIKVKTDGFTKGFYQYSALTETLMVLRTIPNEMQQANNNDALQAMRQANEEFKGFVRVAPVTTTAGIKKTKELQSALEHVEKAVTSGSYAETTKNINIFSALIKDFNSIILKYDVQATNDEINESISTLFYYISFFMLSSVVAGVLGYGWLKKNIIARLEYMKSCFSLISQGNLHTVIDSGKKNEIGGVIEQLDFMRLDLNRIIGSIKSSTDSLNNNTAEIIIGNHDLSSRTEEQASALQQTAASIEQIKTTAAHNAENAKQANQLAEKASETAQNGATAMNDVVATMLIIEQSAQKISDINNVINGIANQTNILALNAAVEAARAGEQGRGFAVVASEVRNLAKHSADAAKEISELIKQSVENVNHGNKLVNNAGNTMQGIVASVAQASSIMHEISLASDEQSQGVNQIATAINEMDTVTQRNAALVEESALITASMDDQAKKLAAIVSVFKLERENAASARRQEPKSLNNMLEGKREDISWESF